ncbi:MAG: outer membrane beta-barrel protein [Verrucomicrobiota bacterium]
MRRLLIVLAVLALATTTFAAGKAAPKEMGMGAGAFLSYWDAKDPDDPGAGLGVLGKMEVMENVCLQARLSLYAFTQEEDVPDAELDASVIPFEVAATYRYALADELAVYGGGGVGYYLVDTEVDVNEPGVDIDYEVDNGFGLFLLGGGVFSLMENVGIFGEIKYTLLKLDTETTVTALGVPVFSDDDEIDLSGLAVNIGAALKF